VYSVNQACLSVSGTEFKLKEPMHRIIKSECIKSDLLKTLDGKFVKRKPKIDILDV